MRTVGSLGLRSFRRAFGRFLLTSIGITLGIGLVFGVTVANDSTATEVARRAGGITRPEVLVTTPGNDMSRTLVDKAAVLPGVFSVWGGVGTNVRAAGRVSEKRTGWLFAGDFRQGPAWSTQAARAEDPRVWKGPNPRAGKMELSMPDGVARRFGTGMGRKIDLVAPSGTYTFTVVQIVGREDGRLNENGGLLSTMDDLATVRGKRDVLDNLSIALDSHADADKWIAAHASALGPGVAAKPGANELWRRRIRDVAKFGSAAFTGAAVVALIVGGFLIYLTLSMVVEERTALYGTLRALGASRRQVRRVVLSEALALSVLCSAAGLVVGLGAATVLIRVSSRLFQLDRPGLVVTPTAVGVAVVLGVVVTIVSALVPARRASRLPPVAAIRNRDEDSRLGRGWIAGAALFGVGTLAALAGDRVPIGQSLVLVVVWTSSALVLVGSILLVPLVVRPLARVVGRITGSSVRGIGDVAVMHLVKERGRSAYTLALIMVVLAMVFAIRSGEASYLDTAARAMHQIFPADITMYASDSLPDGTTAQVAATKGVARVTEISFGETGLPERPGDPLRLIVIDPASYFAVQGMPWREGNDRDAAKALAAGRAVIVPESFARNSHKHVGDSIRLVTPRGTRAFRIAGTIESLQGRRDPDMIVGVRDGRTLFDEKTPDALAIAVADGADAAAVTRVLKSRYASRPDLFIAETRTQRLELVRQFVNFIRIIYAVVLVAIVIGMLGLANTLAMSIYRRTREIGVLRAVGTKRSQVRRMVLVESLTLGVVAALLAVPLGWLLSLTISSGTTAALGMVLTHVYPWSVVPVLAALALVVALAAAVAPARRAARVEPVAALRFE